VNDTFFGTQTLHGDEQYTLDQLTLPGFDQIVPPFLIPNLSTIAVTRGFRTLPNGTQYSAAVGNLALGAEVSNQSWVVGNTLVNGSLLTNYLFDHGVVPSSSYGLHIGSAALRIPGSLYVGGYDKLRVVGPVSAQAYGQASLPIDLIDISIGVATGGSPFNFTSKTGLLAEGNSSLAPKLSVEVDSKEPYLYLPQSTYQAIAANLPVTYSPDLGLYLWNMADPLYNKIVPSPAYLGFTFRANNSVTTKLHGQCALSTPQSHTRRATRAHTDSILSLQPAEPKQLPLWSPVPAGGLRLRELDDRLPWTLVSSAGAGSQSRPRSGCRQHWSKGQCLITIG